MALRFDGKAFRFAASLCLILALLLFNGWFLHFNFERVVEHEAWINHTSEVISELDQVMTGITDGETGQRGYLLTHDERFLEPYRRGLTLAEEHLRALERLVVDNPVQVAHVADLKSMAEKRISHLNSVLNEEQTSKVDSAERRRLLIEGRELMAALRERVDKMKRIERDLLEKRTVEAERVRGIFFFTLIFTTALSLLAVAVAARQIKRNQERLEKEARDRAELNRIREKLTEAASIVAGSLSPEELASAAQKFLAARLNVLSSKVFAFSNGRLTLLSAHGTHEEPSSGVRIRSLVDEAVSHSGLWRVQDVPSDYWRISSELGSSVPKVLIFMPLIFQGRKMGVIEMALFREPLAEDMRVFEELIGIISVSLNAAQSRRELQTLLERTQMQAEELEAQQEELKASNEELEQQARALESQQQTLNIKNRELEQVSLTLEEKARDLEISAQYKSDFLAKMSHELRTPLNGLLILSTLLIENKEKNLTDQQRQFARSIHSAGNDLLMLINDILDLSKIEARKLNLKAEHFSLGAMVESLRHSFTPQAVAKDIEFRVEMAQSAEALELNTDRQRVEQILRNFLSNAIKFTEKGSVTVEAKTLPAGKVELAVRDSGIGVAKDKQDLIFEAFEQADGSVSRKYGGTGLGLTISRELAALLGGEIRLTSKEGEGSRFAFIFPAQLAASAHDLLEKTDAPARHAEMPARVAGNKAFDQAAKEALKNIKPEGRSILIVEDDDSFRKSIVEAAQGYGFQAIEAGDGEAAIAILERHAPDAILLDIKLPGISGLGLLEMVKNMPHLRHIPVHMVSAMDYQHNALRMGALGYLTKPVTMEKIRSAMERIETMISNHVRKILIVEDDERQSMAITSLIAGADVHIDAARTGQDAFKLLREQSYDCVILDLTLPDLNGFEMLEQLNSMDISIPPVVIYTAKDLTPQEEAYLRKYSQSIIIKGARSPERLLDEVNLFLHRVESLLPNDKREMLSQLRSQKDNFEGKTILVVDDDMRNVFALTSALESKNINVRIAKDGVEALEQLAEFADIELVLMDIMMPRMDGFEAMRQIRKHENPRVRAMPVVALTAKAMREDHENCIQAGASDYIPKPVDLNHLTTVLKVWLAPKGIFA